jgi:hypothetical protein
LLYADCTHSYGALTVESYNLTAASVQHLFILTVHLRMLLQADNPNPSAAFADDESVIDRMVAQLEQATQGLPADYKLQPVQFEKVSAVWLHSAGSAVSAVLVEREAQGASSASGLRLVLPLLIPL